MDQLITLQKPTTDQQIAFVRTLRTETVRVLKTSEMMEMLKAIEQNLIAVKLWDQVHTGTPSELVLGVGKALDELVDALLYTRQHVSYARTSLEKMMQIDRLINRYKSKEVCDE